MSLAVNSQQFTIIMVAVLTWCGQSLYKSSLTYIILVQIPWICLKNVVLLNLSILHIRIKFINLSLSKTSLLF